MPKQIIRLKQKRKDYSHMDPERVKSMFDKDKKMSTYDEEQFYPTDYDEETKEEI